MTRLSVSPTKRLRFAITITGLYLAACSSVTSVEPPAALPTQTRSTAANHGAISGRFEILYAFDSSRHVGTHPVGVAADGSGNVFGTTTEDGSDDDEVMFELTPTGRSYAEHVLFDLDCATDGCVPFSGPILDRKTKDIFVVNSSGGPQSGTIIRLSPGSGSYNLAALYGFIQQTAGSQPSGNVIIEGDTVYAMSCCNSNDSGGAAIVALDTETLQGKVVYEFTDGSSSFDQLTTDGTGALYGTTFSGSGATFGTVFKFVPAGTGGTETDLYTFRGGSDGEYPIGPLAFDESGHIYGTTEEGGTSGDGIVFKLTPSGSGYVESILHTFAGPPDGNYPLAGVVIDGNLLWGNTTNGGDANCNCGVIFSLSKFGADYRVRHRFVGTDGAHPETTFAKLDRTLYGTAPVGGPASNPAGVVFQYTP